MDKYEFSIKAEQIKKLSSQGDYKTAMQIADTIDWNRVRNANLLSSIADIYEYNGEYEEAKDILLMAFERAPVGKRFLYKLSELSLRSGSIEEAIEFYKEFLDVSPEDPRKYLLRYKILKGLWPPSWWDPWSSLPKPSWMKSGSMSWQSFMEKPEGKRIVSLFAIR